MGKPKARPIALTQQTQPHKLSRHGQGKNQKIQLSFGARKFGYYSIILIKVYGYGCWYKCGNGARCGWLSRLLTGGPLRGIARCFLNLGEICPAHASRDQDSSGGFERTSKGGLLIPCRRLASLLPLPTYARVGG